MTECDTDGRFGSLVWPSALPIDLSVTVRCPVTVRKHGYRAATNPMKIYGYTRVSTDRQADNGESLETQRNKINGHAMVNGWTVTDIFVEAGVSGSVPLADRPEGAKLLAILNPGDIVITPKLDRMFRSAVDVLVTLEELKAQKVSLHMIDLGGDVVNNGVSKLVFTILSAVAEQERDRIRERIRDVKRDMASRGLYNGGKVPFGFTVDADGALVRDEEQQATIARILTLRKEGLALRSIATAVGVSHMTAKRIIERAGENE